MKRQITVLVIECVEEGQLLVAAGGVVGGVEVQDDESRRASAQRVPISSASLQATFTDAMHVFQASSSLIPSGTALTSPVTMPGPRFMASLGSTRFGPALVPLISRPQDLILSANSFCSILESSTSPCSFGAT